MNIKEEYDDERIPDQLSTVDEVFIKTEEGNVCYECGLDIADRFLLKVGVSSTWHIKCLRCSDCLVKLHNCGTCYFRNHNVYCRRCYCSRFSRACSACNRLIGPSDWVRHARGYVYHLACFSCNQCKRQLSTGEEFSLSGSRIRCRLHLHSNGHHGPEKDGEYTSPSIDDDSSTSSDDTMTSSDNSPKTKRIRTTFTEKQLEVLHAHFKIDVNPDSNCLQNIAQITGLSKRVTQVWFQNSRARQKKYTSHNKVCHVFSGIGGNNHGNCQVHIKMEV